MTSRQTPDKGQRAAARVRARVADGATVRMVDFRDKILIGDTTGRAPAGLALKVRRQPDTAPDVIEKIIIRTFQLSIWPRAWPRLDSYLNFRGRSPRSELGSLQEILGTDRRRGARERHFPRRPGIRSNYISPTPRPLPDPPASARGGRKLSAEAFHGTKITDTVPSASFT
ncbi:hypothetical protein EVAR_43046_1 [Eumeta japonica]|uniref:Uncharacterized protein n=1 Tax=Eumeta variegata TaxID=151549 RepID=A0A4C1XLN9_EUMVA|nr:hypothetical protein EVAR_43046_1 [Eumeta japonica]